MGNTYRPSGRIETVQEIKVLLYYGSPIKISPHQNIAPFDHDFMAGHAYQTANRSKSGGPTYGGSTYGGSTYGGSARRPARCSARRSALKTLRTEVLRIEALRMEALRMEALRIEALHDTLYNTLH